MARPVLIVIHPATGNTGRLGAALRRRGVPLEIRCPARGDRLPESLDPFAGAVMLGGPMSANDSDSYIREEIAWTEKILAAGAPFLGICLGAQIMARAMGAHVFRPPSGAVEAGYYPLQICRAGRELFPAGFSPYQWHQEGFARPAQAEWLAKGQGDFPCQAIRYGAAYGFQFHPEADLTMMRLWMRRRPERLTQPGAQAPLTHFLRHARFAPGLRRFLDRFLDRWLRPETPEV